MIEPVLRCWLGVVDLARPGIGPIPQRQPLADSVGMHPVSFAIISIVALAFGLVTPPYGMYLMVSCAIAKVRLRYVLKDALIMLVPMLLVLAAMIIWPEIPLIVPKLIGPDFPNWDVP